jgi:hypothetical protein
MPSPLQAAKMALKRAIRNLPSPALAPSPPRMQQLRLRSFRYEPDCGACARIGCRASRKSSDLCCAEKSVA